MRINEIITESTDLDEGWKSKLGAAALAAAAAFGGGTSNAEVSDFFPISGFRSDFQNAVYQSDNTEQAILPNIWGRMGEIGYILGRLDGFKKANLLTPDQVSILDKMRNTVQNQIQSAKKYKDLYAADCEKEFRGGYAAGSATNPANQTSVPSGLQREFKTLADYKNSYLQQGFKDLNTIERYQKKDIEDRNRRVNQTQQSTTPKPVQQPTKMVEPAFFGNEPSSKTPSSQSSEYTPYAKIKDKISAAATTDPYGADKKFKIQYANGDRYYGQVGYDKDRSTEPFQPTGSGTMIYADGKKVTSDNWYRGALP